MAEKINNNLKALREEAGITQVDLAKSLNISSDYLSMIERGVRTPSFNLSKGIADYFNTTVDYIFFEINRTKRSVTN